jgi:hypothetical protein
VWGCVLACPWQAWDQTVPQVEVSELMVTWLGLLWFDLPYFQKPVFAACDLHMLPTSMAWYCHAFLLSTHSASCLHHRFLL